MDMRIYPWNEDEGEFNGSIAVQLHSMPREGDYISVNRSKYDPKDTDGVKNRDEYDGTEDFIVRRLCWDAYIDVDGQPEKGEKSSTLRIECEAIATHTSSAYHRQRVGDNAHVKKKRPF